MSGASPPPTRAKAMPAKPDANATILPQVETSQREKATSQAGIGAFGGAAPMEKTKSALTIKTFKVENFSSIKSQIISAFCHEYECDILCLQKTLRGETKASPSISNYTLVNEIPHQKAGSAIFLKRNASFESSAKIRKIDTEQVSVELNSISLITSTNH